MKTKCVKNNLLCVTVCFAGPFPFGFKLIVIGGHGDIQTILPLNVDRSWEKSMLSRHLSTTAMSLLVGENLQRNCKYIYIYKQIKKE